MSKILSCAAVVGLLVASSSSVFAKGPGGGASDETAEILLLTQRSLPKLHRFIVAGRQVRSMKLWSSG